jgi:hypothetical protein
MRQKLGFIIFAIAIIGLLVLINSISFVSEEQKQDSELSPNRSSYHGGPTGTRALYDLLDESGFSVIRWRDAPEKLLAEDQRVSTFVIVGDTRISIGEEEAKSLLAWVHRGGRLVLVDRRPDPQLLPTSDQWAVNTQIQGFPFDVNPGKPEEMTKGVKPITPSQPTLYTQDVNSVMPSQFASAISFAPRSAETGQAPETDQDESVVVDSETPRSPAPVVHLSNTNGALLLDYPHGNGRVVLLADPYIFANGGIGLSNNLQLAVNMLASTEGLIAFDEFHQGRAVARNPFASYFAGTPVLAICAQIVLLILLVLWTQGRRFARPLPLAQVDRRSSLEFVASMAEVQQRARAFDLAIENIYARTRRVLARYAGVDYNSPRNEIATRVAMRSTIEPRQLEVLMRQCEEAINGEPISGRQSLHLVTRLREIEAKLGLRMRSRDLKQAARRVGS